MVRLWILATIVCAVCVRWTQATAYYLEDGTAKKPNTTIISDVLNRLTDSSTYDKRLRPRYGDKPVDVGITIHVSSISAVSEVDMDFTLDFYLRQTWQDPRLAFGRYDLGFDKIESLTVGVDYLDKLWKPDTFFPNEKKSFFHLATTHNSFLRIDPDGTVFTSQRFIEKLYSNEVPGGLCVEQDSLGGVSWNKLPFLGKLYIFAKYFSRLLWPQFVVRGDFVQLYVCN